MSEPELAIRTRATPATGVRLATGKDLLDGAGGAPEDHPVRTWPWGRLARLGGPAALAAVALLAAVPLTSGSPYLLHVGSLICIEAMLVLGLQVIFGFAGQFSFGHAALYGVGAYTAAILMTRTGAPFVVVLPAAAALGALAGYVVGLPATRIGEDYLTLVTLAWAEILRTVFSHWPAVFGDAGNLYGIPRPALFGWRFEGEQDFYVLGLLLLALCLYVVWRLRESDLGLEMQAVRDDELAARGAGVNPGRVKVLAFAIGGGLAGLAGAFYAPFQSVVSAGSFDLNESFSLVIMLIVAGRGSIAGSVLGAALVVGLNERLNEYADLRLGATGALLLLVVFLRAGLPLLMWRRFQNLLGRRRERGPA